MEKAPICFVTGGVRSGKSSFAEQLAARSAAVSGCGLYYLACGRKTDKEMKKRIDKHQEQRKKSRLDWQTGEYPRDIEKAAGDWNNRPAVLLDCLTTLLDNELFLPGTDIDDGHLKKVHTKILNGIETLRGKAGYLVIVSNEVQMEGIGSSIVRDYQMLLGRLHQEIVRRADTAYLVECGIPLLMKGLESEWSG